MPTRDDALAVRRFARARRWAGEGTPSSKGEVSPAATSGDLTAVLASMDAARWAIVAQFGRALGQTTDRDMVARGRRVALNFSDAVAQRCRDKALRPDDHSL